jgi:hypothetical protein
MVTPAPAMDQGILHQLKDMSQEDRRTFYRSPRANPVTGFVLAAALMRWPS